MKKTFLGSCFVVALSAMSTAQDVKPVGLSVRAGLLFPTSSYARDLGRTWFGIGVDYKISDLSMGVESAMPTRLSLSVDWYGKGEASAVPVLLNLTGTSANGWYYSAGAGISFTTDENNLVTTTTGGGGASTFMTNGTGPGGTTTTRQSQRRTNFAFTLAVGYNFSNVTTPVFAEARFFGHSRSELNAFGVYVGVRF
jgi:hypothetical protein